MSRGPFVVVSEGPAEVAAVLVALVVGALVVVAVVVGAFVGALVVALVVFVVVLVVMVADSVFVGVVSGSIVALFGSGMVFSSVTLKFATSLVIGSNMGPCCDLRLPFLLDELRLVLVLVSVFRVLALLSVSVSFVAASL